MTLKELGRQDPFNIKSWKEGKAKGLDDATLNHLVDLGLIPAPDPLDMDVSNASLEEKLLGALRVCEVYLPAEEKEQFRQLFNPTNIAITLSVVGLWAASHGTPIGYIVDIILLAVSIYMTGRQILSAGADLYDFFEIAFNAETVRDLHRAAKPMARFITTIKVEVFMALLTSGPKRFHGPRPRSVPVLDHRVAGRRWWRSMIADAAERTGLTRSEFWRLKSTAEMYGVDIRIRMPKKGHEKLRLWGSPRKPQWAKMKTQRDLDVLLGGPSEPGVAYYNPKKPPDSLKVKDPGLYDRAMKLYEKRKEWWDNADLQRAVRDNDVILHGGLLVDARTGTRFAGDIDPFDFIDARTGRRLKPGDEKYELILERLEGGSTQFQHADHMSWQTIEFSRPLLTCKNTRMKYEIILDHTLREPLVDFRADGTVWRRYADPWFTKMPEPPLGMAFGRGDDPF